MGNLCCLSSKQHKKYMHKPSDLSPAANQTKNGRPPSKQGTSLNTKNKLKSSRLSEIDCYYDEYDEIQNANSSRNGKKAKKAQKQTVQRHRKLSNKSALSYYASDLRMQDGKFSMSTTQTTLLNTTGLDSIPTPACSLDITNDSSCRDNSKVINHLNNSKPNISLANKNSNNEPSLVNTLKLNNQLLINQNNETNLLNYQANSNDLCSSSASSILISSSQISSKSSQNSEINNQSQHSMSSSAFIDPKKNILLKNIQENEDFESEPNLAKKENSRKLSNRTRSSFLNQSLNETNRDLTRSYTGNDSSEFNEPDRNGVNNQVMDDEEVNSEINAITDLNWKKYRSLQKSKRSIKTIEETMKSSRSIEQWLNDFSKLDKDGDFENTNKLMKMNEKNEQGYKNGPLITKRKLIKLDNFESMVFNEIWRSSLTMLTEKIKRSRTSLDENDEINEEIILQEQMKKSCDELKESHQSSKKHRTDSTTSSMHLDITSTSGETSIETDTSLNETSEISDDDQTLKGFLAELARIFSSNIATNNFSTHPQTCQKFFDTVESLIQENKPRVIRKNEQKMAMQLGEFLLPRSNANSDDIDLLKWLLMDDQNLNCQLIEPIINEALYTNDHMIYSTQRDISYLLIANSLKVKLVETGNEMDLNDTVDNDYIDMEKIEILANLTDSATNEFVKFELDPSYNDDEHFSSQSGQILLEKPLIEALLNKEKKIVQKLAMKSGLLNTVEAENDIDLISDQHLLEQLQLILNSSNFKGAQCLFNIKKKQNMNKKNVAAMNSLLKKDVNNFLTPISINNCATPLKRNRSNNSSGTTSPSSSSISPASSNRVSNNNTLIESTPQTGNRAMSPFSFLHNTTSNSQNYLIQPVNSSLYSIQFSDINERLFSCFLSNFSCQLVDDFLKNSSQTLSSTGFIRKKKNDKSFQFVSIVKNEDNLNELDRSVNSTTKNRLLDLIVEKNNFKLCLKLDKWPISYQQSFFNRKRINSKWPSKPTLEAIYLNQCLITYSEPVETETNYDLDFENQENQLSYDEQKLNMSNHIYTNSAKWQINTTYAESTLFKTLNKQQTFRFYNLYVIFMNLPVQLSSETKEKLKKLANSSSSPKKMSQSKFYLFNFINERIFMQHFFRFLEIEEDQSNTDKTVSFDTTLLYLIDQLKKFSGYLSFVLEKYQTLNRPNYFDMSKPILNATELRWLFGAKFSFELPNLFELVNHDLSESLKDFDNLLNNNLINKLHQFNGIVKQQQTSNLLSLFNTFLDTLQLRLPSNTSPTNLHLCPLPAHYSASTYLYEYVYEYTSVIFEQFKSKRDQFKISENLLLQLHKKILSERFANSSNNRFIQAIQHIDPDRLFSKFEEYAECVHKYLPQIRHNNQYLLFHYVWTMQVQYMAPFFNYLCDFYPPVE